MFTLPRLTALSLLAMLPLAAPVAAQEATATAAVTDRDGADVGTAMLSTSASGVTLVTVDLSGLPPGGHGIHLHETGDCSAADFSSAGGHIAGGMDHGIMAENGPHPGDMPNVTVAEDGTLRQEMFLPDIDFATMIADDDGAAVIVHQGTDDYASQPAGDAGDRIACGAFDATGS